MEKKGIHFDEKESSGKGAEGRKQPCRWARCYVQAQGTHRGISLGTCRPHSVLSLSPGKAREPQDKATPLAGAELGPEARGAAPRPGRPHRPVSRMTRAGHGGGRSREVRNGNTEQVRVAVGPRLGPPGLGVGWRGSSVPSCSAAQPPVPPARHSAHRTPRRADLRHCAVDPER